MKKYSVLLLLCLLANAVSAQKYRTALGPRLGRTDYGFSIQQKIQEKATLEGIISASDQELAGTLLAEKHFPILGKGLNYYVGAGGHFGDHQETGNFYGADAIVGAEMKIPLLPFVASIDLKPAFSLNRDDAFRMGGGFSLRYILIKEKKAKKKFGIFGGNEEESGRRKKQDRDKEEKGGGWFGL